MTYALAGPGTRFQGQFIDGIATYFFGFSIFFLLREFIDVEVSGYTGMAVGVTYFLLSDSLPNGQSLGKRLLKIRVVDEKTAQSCSVLQSLLRNITFPLGALDWIFIFFGSRRRLGDFIASTIVVKAESSNA